MGWAESVYTIGQLRKGIIQVTALSGNSVKLTGDRTGYTTTVSIGVLMARGICYCWMTRVFVNLSAAKYLCAPTTNRYLRNLTCSMAC